MAKISVKNPHIITVGFHQEKEDADYGTCLWARFNFDCDNYTLSITSDCGDFSYSWVCTPEKESFIHLMNRISSDYLIEKISGRSVVDIDSTLNCIEDMVRWGSLKEHNIDKEALKKRVHAVDICYKNNLVDEISDYLLENNITDFDDYEISECLRTDFPAQAYKICEIFAKYIQPVLSEM